MFQLKTMLCAPDLKRESLCTECKRKLDEGKITELEIEVARKLAKLNKKFFFRDIELKSAIELGGVIVLICTGNIGAIIGKSGRTISELGKELGGKKCRAIEKTRDEKKIVQDLIGDVGINKINKLFNMGNLEYSIILRKEDEGRLAFTVEELEKGLEKILDAKTKVELA